MAECIVGVDIRRKLKCMEVLEANEFLILAELEHAKYLSSGLFIIKLFLSREDINRCLTALITSFSVFKKFILLSFK